MGFENVFYLESELQIYVCVVIESKVQREG